MRIDGPQVTSSLSLNGTTITDLNVFVTTGSLNGITGSYATTGSLNSFTSSANSRLNSIEGVSGSYATTGSNVFVGTQTSSGSIVPSVNNTYDLGSPTHQFRHVYISSGSLYVNGTKVLGSTAQELQITTDGGQSFKILESGSDTITLQSVDGNVTLTSSGQGDIVLDPTTGIIGLKGTVTVYTGNKITSSDGNSIQFGNGIAVTGSIVSTVTPLVSGSSQVLNGSGVWSGSAQLPSGIVSSSSQLPSGIVSSSLQVTGYGFSTTGSNAFIGTQTITGSLYISSDLVVQGSSSLQNITASAVNIGANVVNLNTANPAIRFAGLNIFDSGSIGGSGSFLYDSVQDEFIFVHRGDNANITSSVVLMGAQTYNNIGNEIYPTSNYIQKGVGNEHLGDSCIFDNGTTTCIKNNLISTGTINGTTIYGSTMVCSPVGLFSGCVGIGTITPLDNLHIVASEVGNVGISIQNTNASYSSQLRFLNCVGTEKAAVTFVQSTNSLNLNVNQIDGLIISPTGASSFSSCVAGASIMNITNTSPTGQGITLTAGDDYTSYAIKVLDYTGVEKLRLDGNGNLLVGYCTDQGYKFGVNGTSKFEGAALFSSNVTVSGTDNNNLIMSTSTTGAGGTFRIQANEAASYLVSNNARPLYIQTNSATVMTITSTGNVGIGVTPCAWAAPTAGKVIQLGNRAAIFSYNNQTLDLSTNLYFDGGDYRYIESAYSTMLRQNTADGTYSFYNASSGTAGGVVSLNERMRITNVGMVCFACQICAPKIIINNDSDNVIALQSLYVAGAKSGYATYCGLWQNQLHVYDNSALATGNGGAISFGGNAGGGQCTWYGSIEGYKENATSGDYGGALVFRTRTNGNPTPAIKMRISSTGQVTKPSQPYAAVGITTPHTSVGETIIWNYAHTNNGNHYNTSTGLFTVPVAGHYLISIMAMTNGADTTLDIMAIINGTGTNALVPYSSTSGALYNQVSGMTILSLAANDTIGVRLNGGTVYGAGTGRHSSVTFALLG